MVSKVKFQMLEPGFRILVKRQSAVVPSWQFEMNRWSEWECQWTLRGEVNNRTLRKKWGSGFGTTMVLALLDSIRLLGCTQAPIL